jgi:hypothetical protein
MAENFMRSAKPPTTSAGVMMANVIWNMANTVSGSLPLTAARSTPARPSLPKPPYQACSAPPWPNAPL